MTRELSPPSQRQRRPSNSKDGTNPVGASHSTIRVSPVEGGHGGLLVTCSRCPNARVLRASEQAANAYAVNHLSGPRCGHGTEKAAA